MGNNLNFARSHYTFTVLANTTATIILPMIDVCKVLQNGKAIKYDGKLTVASGNYTFDVTTVK